MYFDYMMEKEQKEKAEEVTSFLKLPVYTREGKYVGHVKNVFLDVEEKKVSSLLVTNTNPSLVEGSVDVSVPYRWVGDLDPRPPSEEPSGVRRELGRAGPRRPPGNPGQWQVGVGRRDRRGGAA